MSSWASRLATVTAVALLAVYVPYAANLVGREHIDPAKLQRWADSAYLNNKHCIVNRAASACEDVIIHHASHTAFLACGNPIERTKWYPPAGPDAPAARSEASYRESLFSYDIVKGVTRELKIEGLEGDFVTHGLDVFPDPWSKSRIFIHAVRHARDAEAISIFSHELGTNVVTLFKDVQHPGIKSPNAVAATGPLAFYVSNDHYFARGPLRWLENKLGPWSWATEVEYCDASGKEVVCRQVTGRFPATNGLAVWDNKMFVGDSKNGTVTIYDIRPDHGVDFDRQIELGAAADNIRIVPSTGDLIVAVFPKLEDLPAYLANIETLGKEFLAPSAALRLSKKNGYEPELVYHDDGSVLSFMTAMTFDPHSNVAIGASVLQYGGFAVCKIPKDLTK